jgi:predicted DCC family thiol-disulfide oxidoreductase YuxK
LDNYIMTAPAFTIWYNTKCPVCDAGISRQRNKLVSAIKAATIEFRDINVEPQALAAFGADVDDVRRCLHAVDESGRLIVGADVAIAVWRRTPGEGRLAAILGAPGIIYATRFGYDRFADLLWLWNKRNGRW